MGRPRDFAALTVLCFLNEGDRHPYEMLRLVRARHKDSIITGLPRSIYRAIERLHADGLIEPVETTREGRRPERTVYRITADGREEMATQLSRLVTTPEEVPAMSVAEPRTRRRSPRRSDRSPARRWCRYRDVGSWRYPTHALRPAAGRW